MAKHQLIDSNIIIYFLEKSYPNQLESFFQNIFISGFRFSSISKIEALSLSKLSIEEIGFISTFFNQGKECVLSNNIILKAAEIRRNYRLKIPDVVIAATALIHDFELVTRNDKDFLSIPNLSILIHFLKYK